MKYFLLGIIIILLIILYYNVECLEQIENFLSVNPEKHDLHNQETIKDVDFLPSIIFSRKHEKYDGINSDKSLLDDKIYNNNISNMNITDILIK